MKAEDYLKQIEKIDILIEDKLIEKQQWRDLACHITARLGDEKVQSSSNPQSMADAINRCIEIEGEIDKLIDKLITVRLEVSTKLQKLAHVNPVHYNILHKMYIGVRENEEAPWVRMDLTGVADLYKKSYSWATTVYGRALQSFQRILDEERDLKRVL